MESTAPVGLINVAATGFAQLVRNLLFERPETEVTDQAMNIHRILCPIDFSSVSPECNRYASTLAADSGARLIYLHVGQPDAAWGTTAEFDIERETRQLQRQLEDIQPVGEGIQAEWVVLWGPAAARILEYAKEHSVDLIVMGTHGRTGLQRMVTGSVAEAVIRRAECPVLAVRPDSADQAAK